MRRSLRGRLFIPVSSPVPVPVVALALGGVVACGRPELTTETEATTGETETTRTGSSSDSTASTTEAPISGEWEVVLEVGEEVGAFFNLWGRASDDLYAVGGQVDAGVIYHFNGEAWTPETIDIPIPRMNWMHGVGGRVAVVGHFGVALHLEDGVWVRDPTPTDENLWGIWGAAADDLWAVGGSSGNDNPPVILHFDGAAWQPTPYPPVEHPGRALFKVWGDAFGDLYAVGDRGLIIRRSDGVWSLEDSATPAVIIGIWGNAGALYYAGGRSTAVAGRRTGSGDWISMVMPEHQGLDGVSVSPLGVATIVGRRGFIGRYAPGTLFYVLEESNTQHELHSVFETPDGVLYAVGGFFDASPYLGVIVRRVQP